MHLTRIVVGRSVTGTASEGAFALPLSDAIPAHVDVRWLLAGTLLEIVLMDVMAASLVGAGLKGLLPRGGELVRLAFIHRRNDGARSPGDPRSSCSPLWG